MTNYPYGGGNIQAKPFPLHTKIRQHDGTEEYEVVDYDGDIMIIKPLNEAALWGEDTIAHDIIQQMKSGGCHPDPNKPTRLHYSFADRFDVITEA